MRTIEALMFRLKWLVMSPGARYAYLWNRTRSQTGADYARTLRRY